MKQINIIISIIVLLFTQNLSAQTKADTIHASHYDINLEIRNFLQEELKGYTDVTIEAKIAPLSSIYLHLLQLTVDSVKQGNNTLPFAHQGQQLKIDLPFSSVGQSKTVRIYYHGKPFKENFGGFYFTTDYAYNMGVAMN
ncbi:MAG: hypothetical protein FWF70_00715, partial [Bacteroidetes bacterium]|nr:hypothetical protein [Bacteroidota bacterium]